jgi:spoIIIJ-associated protein
MAEDKYTIIKKIVEDFFQKLSPEERIEYIELEENTLSLRLKAAEPEMLIGRNGQVLSAIQYLLAKIINHKLGEKIFVDFDVNQYKKKKMEYLKDLAKTKADVVSLTKKEEILPPMSPFERRIIHLALKERTDVKTESEGEEPQRRVVIKPA